MLLKVIISDKIEQYGIHNGSIIISMINSVINRYYSPNVELRDKDISYLFSSKFVYYWQFK